MSMSEKKQESFTVTDRRLFTSEGDARQEGSEEVSTRSPAAAVVAPEPEPAAPSRPASDSGQTEVPPAPTAAEQKQQAEAYRASAKDMDTRVELSGHSAKELEMTFERFMASLYMSAMMQLGLMHEQGGEPRLDIIGARQTIDTLTLLAAKTKGNLTPTEDVFLQNCLYELRMAYVEVTQAVSHPSLATAPGSGIVKP
jgi:Domain of unknown function (DUF1844)